MSEFVRFKLGWMHVTGITTLSMDLEIIFTLENIHFKSDMCWKYTYIKSNAMCVSVHTLSPISTQESSQTVKWMFPSAYQSTLYSLKYRASICTTLLGARLAYLALPFINR